MTDEEIEKHAVAHAVAHSRDPRTHRWLQITRVGQIVALLVLGLLVTLLFIRQAERDKTALELTRQVQEQCDSGAFSGSICAKADDVEKDLKSDTVPTVPAVVNVKGDDGEKGDEGKRGPKGNDGKPGTDGEDGEDAVAVDGTDGRDGVDGLSAYELAVGTGFQGTLEDWLTSLKGEPGEPGEDAWRPFNFTFTFETRRGVFTCPIHISEDGSQAAPSECEPPPEQTGNTGEDSNPPS